MENRYLITVFLPDKQIIKFKVNRYSEENGRIKFIDEKTNLPKDFPSSICLVEGVEK